MNSADELKTVDNQISAVKEFLSKQKPKVERLEALLKEMEELRASLDK
jgi:hypothetical protein